MKGGRQNPALPHQYRIAFAKGQNLHARSGLNDARSANEDHLQRSARQRGFRGQNSRVNLPPISVALHYRIQNAQAALRRVANLPRQQNGPGAGAKDRFASAELLSKPQRSGAFEEIEASWSIRRRAESAHPGRPARPACAPPRARRRIRPVPRHARHNPLEWPVHQCVAAFFLPSIQSSPAKLTACLIPALSYWRKDGKQ